MVKAIVINDAKQNDKLRFLLTVLNFVRVLFHGLQL